MSACLLLLATLTGCFSNYGRVKRNTEVTQAFVANRVPSNYSYYYWGRTNQPYVIIGIDPDYHLQSRIRREVKPDTPWMLGTPSLKIRLIGLVLRRALKSNQNPAQFLCYYFFDP